MLEARVKQASVLKKLLDGTSSAECSRPGMRNVWRAEINFDFPTGPSHTTPDTARADHITAIKELVTDGNLDCSDEGIVSLEDCIE